MEKYFCPQCEELKEYEVKTKAQKQYILYLDLEDLNNSRVIPEKLIYLVKTLDVEGDLAIEILNLLN